MENIKGKYWIIKKKDNIKECLKYLGIHEDYIEKLMCGSDFFPEYICLYYTYGKREFVWTRYEDRYYLSHNYELSNINLRKEKLKRLI